MAKQTKFDRQEAAGIPDSKIFAAADDAFPENPVLDCHVGGVPVRDLPLEMQGRILYQQTDEGILEYNSTRSDSGVSVSRDSVDKTLDERRSDLRERKDPRHAQSPLRFLDNYKKPGFKHKLLTTKNGELNPDYVPVKKANGDVLKYKNMVVGEIPVAAAEERNEYYQQRSHMKLDQLSQRHKEEGGVVTPNR